MKNVTSNSSEGDFCQFGVGYVVCLSLIDIITLLVGQPVVAKLLWITFTSMKTIDILNFNLALFHNLQYLMSILHLFILFLLPDTQTEILKFIFVYSSIGGPMSLSFICMERYVAVIHPTSYPLLKTHRCREVSAVTVWLVSVPTALMSVLAEDTLSPLREEVLRIIPLSVMMVMTAMVVRCSVSILRTLKKSGPGKDKLHPVKKRAFKTVCATSTIAVFCYTPVTLLQNFTFIDGTTQECVVTPACIFMLSVASVVHPLFYLSTQGKLFTCLK